MKKSILAVIIVGVLVSSSGAMAGKGPPGSAHADCPTPSGDPDYAVSYAFGEPDILIEGVKNKASFRVIGRIYAGDTVAVAATSPDGGVTAMFVFGEQNQIVYYRDGKVLDTKECKLIDAEYPQSQ